MASQVPKSSSKPTKPPNQSTPTPSKSSSSVSSHLAMIELKQRILTSLSKLSDRDTHQIAVEDLQNIIQTLSNDGVSMLLNCLYDASNDPKPAVKKEALRLLPTLCTSHPEPAATHLTKIISHIVKRLKDSDSGVRDACRDAIGSLSSLYLKGEAELASVFVKPLFEAMNENNKTVQSGAAMCMTKMVECASDPPLSAFQKLCPRICKYLNHPNFLAKASLLPLVSSLSQAGAIAPQNLEPLLQTIHECLSNSDWTTRKAAADTLSTLALKSSNLVAGGATSTLAVLEASRFDKIKPVRDSMLEALLHWKKVAGKEDGATDDQKASCHDGESSESAGSSEKKDLRNAVGMLKKRAPALSDRKLNPEFFQKLEERSSGDLPVEVVVPRQCLNASNAPAEVGSEPDNAETGQRTMRKSHRDARCSNVESLTSGVSSREHDTGNEGDLNQRELSSYRAGFAKNTGQSEGFMTNKGNWVAIQRQLLLLERQQAHLTNMLQDFMGGSHGSMVALENRVRGLERVVEDMARDLSLSTDIRGSTFTTRFDESSNRPPGKYNGFHDYSNTKLGRGSEGSIPFGERFVPSENTSSGMRGRSPPRRSDNPDAWDFHAYGKSGQLGSRRGIGGGPMDARSSKPENEIDQVGTRRGWAKGAGPVRFGEGPSARSIWQASKDEATLEAIRVAGEDNGTVRGTRVAIPELEAEALTDDNNMQERDPVWTSWTNAMDALSVGDIDSAFSEVLSTGDDFLLVKLMDRSGPVIDQLSIEVASEVLHAIAQFLLEANLTDICISWLQQLVDITVDNGPDVMDIPEEVKKEVLLNLNEISSSVDMPEDWEGATPEQVLLQLASAWEIDLQELDK